MDEYEQVQCDICGRFTGRGYLAKTGRIVCRECLSRQKKGR